MRRTPVAAVPLAASLLLAGLAAPQAAWSAPQAAWNTPRTAWTSWNAPRASWNAPRAERQEAFRAAAARYGVPEKVLLAVSYLESRWDAHQGLPSVTAGYGPMHLTDPRRALRLTGPHDALHPTGPRRTSHRAGPRRVSHRAGRGTAEEAARLTGISADRLVRDPGANILGGAALLARHQRDLGLPMSPRPADWSGAVARYSGATGAGDARHFAGEVFSLLRTGAGRITDDGRQVWLSPSPEIAPHMEHVDRMGLREGGNRNTDCPANLACEWLPAPYRELPGGGYGNHDLSDRPREHRIEYIVIHDTEETYGKTLRLVDDPTYVSWHYTIRSSDGHIAQHVRTRDIAWHSGNWYVNAKAIGIEHEGFLAKAGAWYTEAMYRSSARLVRYLARRYGIPLDRAHILGHDNVPGTVPGSVAGMHVDPGPYWDWGHYFALMGSPFKATGGAHAGLVTIRTDYARHRPRYTGCEEPGEDCRPHGSASVRLHTAPGHGKPLVRDVGRRSGGRSTYGVHDHGARATTGQQYALAGRKGDWTAIWYLGQRAWFHNPHDAPTAVNAGGLIVTPRPGRASVPVYGRAYPEPEAYPKGVPVQPIVPLQYMIPRGQRYAVGLATHGEYYHSTTYDETAHRLVRGRTLYYQVQLGHRVAFVKADDVDILPSSV
ncbi:N-acetylmuramoyl-L-alanine amidase [Sphaerisporangium dianthi]|uniref:N-acetylmuramoyl-L-alanine amidase n=1 Tax=Sphaerisporangium dianthi TaxID=1436120 RepID=A0ABV9CAB0_9ACTN